MPSFAVAAVCHPPRFAKQLTLLALVTISGCSWIPFTNQLVYKVDVQQGAVVTQEMAAQLHPGMTREQVRFILGSPPLIDPFHANRWDYDYRFQPGRGPVVERRFAVFFEHDKMQSTEGDPLPTEAEFIATRIRLNSQQTKAEGLGVSIPTVSPAAPAPDAGQNSGPAPASPASTSPTQPQSAPTPPETAPVPGVTESPSLWQRIKNAFSDTPDQSSKSTAPSAPNGPGS